MMAAESLAEVNARLGRHVATLESRLVVPRPVDMSRRMAAIRRLADLAVIDAA